MKHHSRGFLILLPCASLLACSADDGDAVTSDEPTAPTTEPAPERDAVNLPSVREPRPLDPAPSSIGAGDGAPSCGAWGSTPPAPAAGVTLGDSEIVGRFVTGDAYYRLELEAQKGLQGPPNHRLLLVRECTAASCVCPGVMLVGTLGWKPTVSMVVGAKKAAIYAHDLAFNGGAKEFVLRADLAGAAPTTVLRIGASGADECTLPTGHRSFGFVSAAATNDGADLELVGNGCASGQVGTGSSVRLVYRDFFRDVALAGDLAEEARRF